MIIHKQPQISQAERPTLNAKGEKLAITASGDTKIYDLSLLEAGQIVFGPNGHLLGARRETDGLHVDVLWPISPDASDAEKYPEPVELVDVSLPDGEKISLDFTELEGPRRSTAEELLAVVFPVALMMDRQAGGENQIPDTAILRSTALVEYDSFAFDIEYKKGKILEHDGQYYEVIEPHTSNAAHPIETTFAYYRWIHLDATGAIDDPIPYPETAGTVVAVVKGLYYAYKGKTYQAMADMPHCIWTPDTPMWQWEAVE